jgi:hypothetical protein
MMAVTIVLASTTTGSGQCHRIGGGCQFGHITAGYSGGGYANGSYSGGGYSLNGINVSPATQHPDTATIVPIGPPTTPVKPSTGTAETYPGGSAKSNENSSEEQKFVTNDDDFGELDLGDSAEDLAVFVIHPINQTEILVQKYTNRSLAETHATQLRTRYFVVYTQSNGQSACSSQSR